MTWLNRWVAVQQTLLTHAPTNHPPVQYNSIIFYAVHSPFWLYNVIILCGMTTALKCRHFFQHCSRCCSSFLRSLDLRLWRFGPWRLILGSSGPSKNSSPGKIWHHQTPWPQAMKSLMPCKWVYYHCKIVGTVYSFTTHPMAIMWKKKNHSNNNRSNDNNNSNNIMCWSSQVASMVRQWLQLH